MYRYSKMAPPPHLLELVLEHGSAEGVELVPLAGCHVVILDHIAGHKGVPVYAALQASIDLVSLSGSLELLLGSHDGGG